LVKTSNGTFVLKAERERERERVKRVNNVFFVDTKELYLNKNMHGKQGISNNESIKSSTTIKEK
jgi:hypothetical protein